MKFFLLLSALFILTNATTFDTETNQIFEFDVDITGITKLLGNQKSSNSDKLKCLYDKLQKILDDNADLDSWFDDAIKISLISIDGAEKCNALSGLAKTRCLLKLQSTLKADMKQLQEDLPEDKKDIPKQAKTTIMNCLSLE